MTRIVAVILVAVLFGCATGFFGHLAPPRPGQSTEEYNRDYEECSTQAFKARPPHLGPKLVDPEGRLVTEAPKVFAEGFAEGVLEGLIGPFQITRIGQAREDAFKSCMSWKGYQIK